jgi:creatinine amidohydrolase
MSGGGFAHAGTLRIRGTVLIDWIHDVMESYRQAGARRILIVNGHYENEPFIFEGIERCREDGLLQDSSVIALSWWSAIDVESLSKRLPRPFVGWHAEHAGLCETSLMMYLYPDAVRSQRPEHESPPPSGVYVFPPDPDASTLGVLSSTSGSSAEIGHFLFGEATQRIAVLARTYLLDQP